MKPNFAKQLTLFILFFVLLSNSSYAQQKPTLTVKDYDQWHSIQRRSNQISNDGKWASYQISVNEANDTLLIKTIHSDKFLFNEVNASRAKFSKNSKWIAYRIGVSKKKSKELKEKKKPMHFKLGLIDLESGKKSEIEDVESFSFSENGNFLAFRPYKPKGQKEGGSILMIKNLKNGDIKTIGHVSEYKFNKIGDRLAFIIDPNTKYGHSVELYNLVDNSSKILDSDTTKYNKLCWNKKGTALAFFKEIKNPGLKDKTNQIIAFRDVYKLKKEVFSPLSNSNFPNSDKRIFSKAGLTWSKDLSSLFFGIKESDKVEKKDDKSSEKSSKKDSTSTKKKKKDSKLAGVDIWHWNDDVIQPKQKKQYNANKNFAYKSVWNLDDNSFIQLNNIHLINLSLTEDQKHSFYKDPNPYLPVLNIPINDYYLVNNKTGATKKILVNTTARVSSSPDGKYLLYYHKQHWYSYHIATDTHVNLTQNVNSAFWNTVDNGPLSKENKGAFGSGGWLKNDAAVLLYDQFDVYRFNPDGSGHTKLTQGKADEVRYRVQRLDFEDNFIDDSKPIYLSMYGDKTKKFGYSVLKKTKVKELIFDDVRISDLVKSKTSENFLYVKQDYDVSPNIYYVKEGFKKEKRVSNTNEQQQNFAWGKSELIDFTNADGKKMQGALFYPANYDSSKKYPMLVYIYEIRSNSVHNYTVPSAKSFYNVSNYTQQGYFVFQPDIVYGVNDPGVSAVKCVVPAVEEMIKTGMIDEKRIGLVGHSWGAYQTAFIITQTNIFTAAVAGAPLTDMISMYLGVYWNSGGPNQIIFETSQGRFNKPYWEIMDEYIENSPIFNALNIETPLLVAFGDKDGAVDWHQGLEMYSTLRRMKKSHILLVYEGENHSVRKEENMLDYTKRVNEYFDFYLKGKKDKQWIKEGIPYLEKMKKVEAQKEKSKKK